jgi:hypothetical protein
MNAPARRDDAGHFLPGISGNPTGRPKGAGEIRELARQYVPAALTKIGELVGSADPRVALAAAQEVLNRVYGKPLQSLETDVRTLNINEAYLKAMQLVNRSVVDVTPPPKDATAAIELLPSPDEPATDVDHSTEW